MASASPRAWGGLVVTRNRPPDPPVHRMVSGLVKVDVRPRASFRIAPATRPLPSCSRPTARACSMMRMWPAAFTAAVKAPIMAFPARSPATRATRGCEWAASRLSARRPSRCAVEGNAEFDQVAHPFRSVFGDEFGNRRIDQACASHHRIGRVLFRTVLWMQRSGKAALGPRRRRGLSKRRRRNDGARARRQAQGQEQASQSGPDNQNARIACRSRGGICFGPRPAHCGQEMPPSALFHSAGKTLPALTSAPCMRDADWMVRVKLSGA